MTVGELREKLADLDPDLDVIVEVEKGRKYKVFFAKRANLNLRQHGLSRNEAFWIVCKEGI